MRIALSLFFVFVFVAMVLVTGVASLDRGVFAAGSALWPDPWFRATLADAYFGFLTVWVWVAYRERTVWARLAWLAGFLTLGNLAMAAYALLSLRRLPADAPLWHALLRPEHRPAGRMAAAAPQR